MNLPSRVCQRDPLPNTYSLILLQPRLASSFSTSSRRTMRGICQAANEPLAMYLIFPSGSGFSRCI
ncbi:MAG TPA: hypothetical protein VFV07_12315, partial [Rhizomicrobium sp.]|nr:hypothetical protein [Rhizomicrobium sp.]